MRRSNVREDREIDRGLRRRVHRCLGSTLGTPKFTVIVLAPVDRG